jgi:PadR family transcriptional regulator, regulatory protein PadR
MPGRRRKDSGPCRKRRRRGTGLVLRPGLLLMLAEDGSHGYELIEQLETLGFDPDCLDSSIIYRNLRELEEQGLVDSHWDEEDTKGPKRRVYQINETGWDQLGIWLDNLTHVQQQIADLKERYQQLNAVKD